MSADSAARAKERPSAERLGTQANTAIPLAKIRNMAGGVWVLNYVNLPFRIADAAFETDSGELPIRVEYNKRELSFTQLTNQPLQSDIEERSSRLRYV